MHTAARTQVLGSMLSSTMTSLMAHQDTLEAAFQGMDDRLSPEDLTEQVGRITALCFA